MAGHGSDNRGLAAGALPGVAFGRFGQMFDPQQVRPALKLPEAALRAIAEAMIKEDVGAPITELEPVDENPTLPAGYTYFGQFVDHDITFDPTPLNASEVDVSALVDFRSPALDLDNVYGRGPDDQPYLYDGLRLRVGRAMDSGGAGTGTRHDLFRLDPSGIPVLGDKRNDENKIVSQIHGALIAFHNKVVGDDALIRSFGADPTRDPDRFQAAAAILRWHYQWVVLHDYLERICEPGMVTEVLNPGGTPRLTNYLQAKAHYAYMPVEFSGAAFRFGHSMVRPSYALNSVVFTTDPNATDQPRIPTFSGDPDPRKNMNGFPGTLPDHWGIDWGYFLDGELGAKTGPGFKVPQPSYRIDALLAGPLADLPEFRGAKPDWVRNLAFRNLQRGQMLRLPSGQAVAMHLGIAPLPDDILWDAGSRLFDATKAGEEVKQAIAETRAARAKVKAEWLDRPGGSLRGNTPLWYYILREAEYYGVTHDPNEPAVGCGGQHLGPVGSRIVAETLIGMLWCDKSSFLHSARGFAPLPGIARGAKRFTLDRLVAFALG
jgi:hypothetical protein